jgi:hypothetical protein
MESVSLEQEINPWEAQAARFDFAARKLNLEEGLWKLLRTPAREIIVHFPVTMDTAHGDVHRLPGAALDRPRSRQGRHPLRARRDPGRGARAGQLDDLEVRGGQYPLRRRQGRRHLRPQEDEPGRAGAHDPPLHLRDHRLHRAGEGRSRARHEHQRADHGLDHGHLLHAHGAHGHQRGHRQAAEHRRLARPAEATGRGVRWSATRACAT